MGPQASCSPLNLTFHIFKIGVLISTSQMGASSLSLGGVSPLLWALLHTVDQETSWDVVAQS